MNKEKRDLRLDIIRLFAFFCVVAVHFFLNSNFYEMSVSGKKMYIMVILRSLFIICVPLFIMLTGYLMNKKELSKKYYKGIIKILVIYFICSVIYHLFSIFYLHNPVTIKSFIKDLFSYGGTKYAWYVELYVGLFLLIPFLNMIFISIKDKKQMNYLLITLFFLTGMPAFLNHLIPLFPMWWYKIYPLFYYFLGAYLYKYKINISIKKNIVLLLIILLFDGTFNFLSFHNSLYIFTNFNDYSSATVMITTFLTFNLLLKININSTTKKEKVLKTISDAVFGAYLLSCVFDIVIYDKLFHSTYFAPLIVLLVYILSLLSSVIINYCYNKTKKMFNKT